MSRLQEVAGERRRGRVAGHAGALEADGVATLALLCRAEVSHREQRRIQMGTGIAKFPCQRTLEGFDFAAQPSRDAKQVRDLAACRWVANGDALLIQGPPGVGKTHLAIALGREAIRHGYSVLFTGATALVNSYVAFHDAPQDGMVPPNHAPRQPRKRDAPRRPLVGHSGASGLCSRG